MNYVHLRAPKRYVKLPVITIATSLIGLIVVGFGIARDLVSDAGMLPAWYLLAAVMIGCATLSTIHLVGQERRR